MVVAGEVDDLFRAWGLAFAPAGNLGWDYARRGGYALVGSAT